jgi:hypothetical protein
VQFKTSFKTLLLTIMSITVALNGFSAIANASDGTKDGGGGLKDSSKHVYFGLDRLM